MGVDGEGCGRNRHGQQHFMLLRAGPYELFTGKPLTTLQSLGFMCDIPDDPLLVGFSFGYDASQILRDLPPERLAHLFADKPMGEGRSRYTWFDNFGIEYLPKNYLRVCRLRRRRDITPSGKLLTSVTSIPGSARTVYETFGFFQKSFLAALQDFGIGAEHWEMIERNKAARAGFLRITREIRRYNQLECDLLAQLMERFREVCHGVGLRPRTWNGAGKLAAAEHGNHGTITKAELEQIIPAGVLQFASDAYYGGRFEVTRIGAIECPIWEYDINSAYPAAMRSLPCLLHGTWESFIGKPDLRSLHVAYVHFRHDAGVALCGLPIRQHDGHLFWPREGQGVYWSVELNAARRLGARVRYTAGFRYVTNCTCRPFDWIEHRYRQRVALGKSAAGYPIKHALNSLYGKLAQRIGNPRWGNLIWAGLITAATRAKLLDAAAQAPGDVVMFATDALFSKAPLSLPVGDRLGQWDPSLHDRLFIVQPGVYWGAKRPKTRGVPASLFVSHTTDFESAWALWATTALSDFSAYPAAYMPVPLFTGLRLAHARGKPETAGVWLAGCKGRCEQTRNWRCAACRAFSFDWSRKRSPEAVWEAPLCAATVPQPGAPDLVSVAHGKNRAWSDLNEQRMQFDDQPDSVDLSPIR